MCSSDSLKEKQKVYVEKVLWGNPESQVILLSRISAKKLENS